MDDLISRVKHLTVSVRPASTPPAQDIHISYKTPNWDNEAWITRRLIELKEPILFVGESPSRSLAVPLAVMRGSWDGIWASSEQANAHRAPEDLIKLTKVRSAANAKFLGETRNRRDNYAGFIHTGHGYQEDVDDMRLALSVATDRLDAKSKDAIIKRLFLVIDAENLASAMARLARDPRLSAPPTRNIWFQCPWRSGETARLIRRFIESAAAVQQSGDAVFIGLTALSRYTRQYALEDLKVVARKLGYEIFIDECFIRYAIDAGYWHEGVRDIHDYILDYHQTFVFVKRKRAEHALVRDRIQVEREALYARLADLVSREKELTLVEALMSKQG